MQEYSERLTPAERARESKRSVQFLPLFFYVTEARRVDGYSHRQVIQSSVVGLDQRVVWRKPRMLSKFMQWRESSRSARAHGELSELSELCLSAKSARSVVIANGVWSEFMRCS